MKMSEKTDKLFPALFKAKSEMGPVIKNGHNPHFKSGFATLNDHLEMIEPILEKHGLMVMQPPSFGTEGQTSVVTILIHAESGQWLASELPLTSAPDMQKTLAAITYARRGALNAFFSLRAVDDDGETAVGRGKSGQASPQVSTAPKSDPKPFNRKMVKEDKKEEEPAQTASASPAKKEVVW